MNKNISDQAVGISSAAVRMGFVDLPVDPTMDLFKEIAQLKREKHAVILAHYYQDADIQDVADYVGDSLGLSQEAARTEAEMIVFAGVHFMAETAKILNPHKKVLLPDLNAGCSLSDSCPADVFAAFKAKHPNHVVVSYINCSADLKALSDYIVTSSNAVKIVASLPPDQKIIFAPDKNLGAWVAKQTGRDLLLWNGACMVHEIFNQQRIRQLRALHPQAKLIAHPECEEAVLQQADFIGSTTGLLNYATATDANGLIVATEPGILHQMRLRRPDLQLIPAPSNHACACNNCPHMKLNTLEKLYNCLKCEAPEVTIPEATLQAALIPIQRMLALSK